MSVSKKISISQAISLPTKSKDCIVITGGICPSKAKVQQAMKALDINLDKSLQCSPYVIVADSGFDTAMQLGIQIDLCIGDFDSVRNDITKSLSPTQILTHPIDKDFTDTELALIVAHEHTSKRVILIGGAGGNRIDHLFAIYESFIAPYHADVWVTGEQILYCLSAISTARFLPNPKDYISVFRVSRSAKDKIISQGLEWESSHFRSTGYMSVSNRIKLSFFARNTPVELKILHGSFLLCLPIKTCIQIQ